MTHGGRHAIKKRKQSLSNIKKQISRLKNSADIVSISSIKPAFNKQIS